jgi:hypothetical protein
MTSGVYPLSLYSSGTEMGSTTIGFLQTSIASKMKKEMLSAMARKSTSAVRSVVSTAGRVGRDSA